MAAAGLKNIDFNQFWKSAICWNDNGETKTGIYIRNEPELMFFTRNNGHHEGWRTIFIDQNQHDSKWEQQQQQSIDLFFAAVVAIELYQKFINQPNVKWPKLKPKNENRNEKTTNNFRAIIIMMIEFLARSKNVKQKTCNQNFAKKKSKMSKKKARQKWWWLIQNWLYWTAIFIFFVLFEKKSKFFNLNEKNSINFHRKTKKKKDKKEICKR